MNALGGVEFFLIHNSQFHYTSHWEIELQIIRIYESLRTKF